MHASRDLLAIADVATHDREVLEPVVAVALLALDVPPVTLPALVVDAVVLADGARRFVEQVGIAEQHLVGANRGWLHNGAGSIASSTQMSLIRVSMGERLSLLAKASARRTNGTPV